MKQEANNHCRLHINGAIDKPCNTQCIDCGVKHYQEVQKQIISDIDLNDVNAYTCGTCKQNTVIKHRDKGVTPFMIDCFHCSNKAISHMYKVPQDLEHHLVAFKPKNKSEWKLYLNYLMQYYDSNNMEHKSVDVILKALKEHVAQGGVLMIAADKLKIN